MAARFPQSATSVAYRIKPAYASKVLAIYWAASANSVHRLYSGDTASTILTRASSGAGFNATDGRITGTVNGASGVYFSDSKSGGFGTTEAGPLTYIAAYFGDLFNGGANAWLFGCATPMDTFNDHFGAKVNSYGIDLVRKGAATLTLGSGVGLADDVAAWCVLGYRYDPADATAHHRLWNNGSELTGQRANGASGISGVVGGTSTPFIFGGTVAGTGNTKLEGECWIVGKDISDADMAAITADPSTVIEVYSGGSAPSITTNPSNQSVSAGATATFTAAASGSPTPTFQWQRNPGGAGSWADISGAVAASYTTPATTVSGGSANNGDTYRCVATNTNGSATTTAATLTVSASNAAPTFPGPSITDMTLGLGAAMSAVNVASKFNDTDALTFSAVGSWPPGLSVSSAGVISGTPSSAGAYTSLKVRATDTASQTVDSNTFTITISASAGTLNFQAAGMEFGRRTGLGIATFALDAASNYRYTVHANALTLGSAVYSSGVVATDSAGKLPNLTDASLVTGTTYRVHAIRQADGEAATFRMVAT